MTLRRRLGRFVARRYVLLLVLILLLGLGLRVGTFLDLRANDPTSHIVTLDAEVFLSWAGQIAAGDVRGDRPFFLNPLYPYFLAPIVGIAGDDALSTIRLAQGALGLASVLLVAGATRRLVGPGAALVAALIAAAYPPLLFFEQAVMIVTLAVFLNALTLLLLSRMVQRPGLRAAFLAGLPLGLAVLARPNVGLFALLLPLWLLGLAPEGRRLRFAAVRTLVITAGAFLMVLPVTVRNYVVGKDLVLVTWSLGTNLYNSNNPKSWREGRMASEELRAHPILIESDSVRIAEKEEGRPLSPTEVSSYWVRRTFEEVGREPGRALGFLGRKLLFFLRSFELPSSYHYEAQREQTVFLRRLPGTFGSLCTLSLLGALVVALRRRRRPGLLLVWLFVAYAAGLAVFYPLGHYRAPVLPAAIPLAAIGLVHLFETATLGRPRTFLLVVLALLVALGATHAVDLADSVGIEGFGGFPDDRAVFFYNLGIFQMGQGKEFEAERSFRTAGERDPTSWLPDLGMAFLSRNRGDLAIERVYLEKVLRRQPKDAMALAHLGRNFFDRGERKVGLRMAEDAARKAPRDWPIRGILAAMYFGARRYEDAAREFEALLAWGLPSADAYLGLAISLRLTGRLEEALERVEEGLVPYRNDERLAEEKERIREAMQKERQ